MEAYELLKQLETVKAPPDFEQKLMVKLSSRRKKQVRQKTMRYSFAGAFAGVFALLIVINFLLLSGRGPVSNRLGERSALSELDLGGRLAAGDIIPITETMDYSSEIRTLSNEVPTVYILEQVSWTTDTKIRY